jgi:hypothetical protein
MPEQSIVMHKEKLESMYYEYGTNGWVYIEYPSLVFSTGRIDQYLVPIHIYASTMAKVESMIIDIRRALVGATDRTGVLYTFRGYNIDSANTGGNHAVVNFEAKDFFK